MPVLQLQYRDRVINRIKVEQGLSLTIGRHPENDVVIDNGAVSSRHAKVDGLDGGYFITDLESTNGTFVNSVMVKTCQLRHGDSIVVGRHRILFGYAKGEDRPDKAPEELDKTVVIDAKRPKSTTFHPQINAYLSILKGGSGEIPLTAKVTKIGKDPTCDIHTSGFGVGKVALSISKMPRGYEISYVSGLKKPRINGEPLKAAVKLREFDTIDVGGMRLQFIYRDSLTV